RRLPLCQPRGQQRHPRVSCGVVVGGRTGLTLGPLARAVRGPCWTIWRQQSGFPWRLLVPDFRTLVEQAKPMLQPRRSYSKRNATIGSTRVARIAGTRHAISATAESTTDRTANVIGSVALTPYNMSVRSRVR